MWWIFHYSQPFIYSSKEGKIEITDIKLILSDREKKRTEKTVDSSVYEILKNFDNFLYN